MFEIVRSLLYLHITLTLLLNATFGHPAAANAAAAATSSSSSTTYERDRFSSNSKCIDTETGRELYVGDSFTRSGRCIRVQCLGSLQLWQDRCQIPQLEGNCYRVPAANEFLDYPRCCPTYECKNYKYDDNRITDEIRTYDHYGRLLREHITQKMRILVKPQIAIGTTNQTNEWNRDYNIRGTAPAPETTDAMRSDNVFRIKYN